MPRFGSVPRRATLGWVGALAAMGYGVLIPLTMSGVAPAQLLRVLWLMPLALVGWIYPGAAFLTLIAVPPGLMAEVGPTVRLVLVGLILGATMLKTPADRSRRFPFSIAVVALAALAVLALFNPYPLTGAARRAAESFRMQMLYTGIVGITAFFLSRRRMLAEHQLTNAIVVAGVGTVAIAAAQILAGNVALQRLTLPGLLFERTHFGYLVALAFAGLVGSMARVGTPRSRTPDSVLICLTIATAIALVASTTRGAWVGAAGATLLATMAARRRLRVVAVLGVLLILGLSVQAMAARLTIEGGVFSPSFTTGRSTLWAAMWPYAADAGVTGHGFGFVFSLTPSQLLGQAGAFTTAKNPFVYPHNDFMYVTLDFGLLGLFVFLILWLAGARAALRAKAIPLACALLVAFFASLFDNGLFILALAERTSAVIGFALGMSYNLDKDRQGTAAHVVGIVR